MIEYILVFLFIIFILINENKLKFYQIRFIYDNYNFIKFIIKNVLYAIPLITLYFNYDNITGNVKKNSILNDKLNNYKSNNVKIKRNVNESVKKFIASNQQWKCKNCNNLLDFSYEIDHIIPLYKNGTNDLNNLQALCRNCHGKKTLIDKLSFI